MKGELINKINGQSVLEVLIALSILAIVISSAVFLVFQSQSFSVDADLSNSALYLSQKQIENAQLAAKTNFSSLINSSSTVGNFFLETIVENIDSYSKKIISRASWQIENLRPQKIELETILTDWKNVVPPPDQNDTGGSGLSGDWRNPRTLGTVDLGPGNEATDIDVVNKIVYLSAKASAEAKPDFYIVNAANGQNPFIISSLNTGSGLNALDVSANYAYVANESSDSHLQIIDISNINSPFLASSLKLVGVSGSAEAKSIFYAYSKIYIGIEKATGPEFHIIDVSNPLNPVELGSIEINADVNGIYVSGNFAYLATSDGAEEMKIFDVSNSAAIVKIGGYNASGNQVGKSAQLIGQKLYFGQKSGTSNELYIINVSSSTSPQLLGSKEIGADLNDMRIRDNLAFLGTSDSNKEFQVWDISNPANINFWSSFNFPQVATGIDYEDNIVYVSVRSNDALRIITSQ